jgi:4-aminobutyrate aminotransferase-like enzyme
MRPAALLVDTIFSSDGIYPDPPGFLAGAAAAIRAAGGLFIADEVQAGFARTGPAFWGFARHGLTPDIVTMGKPMANGHPVGGVVVRADLARAFGSKVRYFNTFGGNPVSAAAALATLQVIEDEGLAENAAVMGARLAASLAALPGVKEVRHAGLFFGVELDRPAGPVVGACKEAGVLLSATGTNILKMRPPLILKAEEADQIAEGVAEGLKAAGA